LIGYDHEKTTDDAEAMETLEQEILAQPRHSRSLCGSGGGWTEMADSEPTHDNPRKHAQTCRAVVQEGEVLASGPPTNWLIRAIRNAVRMEAGVGSATTCRSCSMPGHAGRSGFFSGHRA